MIEPAPQIWRSKLSRALQYIGTSVLIPIVASTLAFYWNDNGAKRREAELTHIAQFSASGSDLSVAVAAFVDDASLANSNPSHERVREELVKQVEQADSLSRVFTKEPVKRGISDYRDALSVSIQALNDADDPQKIVRWGRTFVQLVKAKAKLLDELARVSGV